MAYMTRNLPIVICLLLLCISDFAAAQSKVQVSQELTNLFMAARKVISDNQAHINDAEVGDKGLSAMVVEQQTRKNYQALTGKPLSADTQAKKAMLLAVKAVMTENQDLINEQGIGLKGLLPAIFARQVANKFNRQMNDKMQIKLTAPRELLRNRANRPDKWENNVISNLFAKADYEKGKAFSEQVKFRNKQAFRFILPEYYKPSCLNCHGKPKGQRDITGGKKEGGELGQLGGAISLVIF